MPNEKEVLAYLNWLRQATIEDEGENSAFIPHLDEVINLIEAMS